MKQLAESPFFYFGFFVLAGIVHYLLLSSEGAVAASERDTYLLFMQNTSGKESNVLAAGPLTFFFYHLFSYLSQSPLTAFNIGTALLGGTLACVLLKFSSKLKLHLYTLIFVGIWSVISPSIRYTLSHYPHLILGMIFFLLLFLSLMRKNYFLIVVFLIHLFLTHAILAMLSVILIAGMLTNPKNAPYMIPSSIAVLLVLIFHPGLFHINNISLLFSPEWHFSPAKVTRVLNPQGISFLWIGEIILMLALFAGFVIYLIRNLKRNKTTRSECLHFLMLFLLGIPVYNFHQSSAGLQIHLAFLVFTLPAASLLIPAIPSVVRFQKRSGSLSQSHQNYCRD
ncbi:MAG: hypothetical protein ACQER7_01450 [Bacteroidota bacterium]